MHAALVLPLLDNTVDPTAHASVGRVQIAAYLLAVVLPILVGLLTKVNTSSQTKALLHLALAAITGFVTEATADGPWHWQQALVNWITVFVVGVATHFGVFRPTGVADKAQAMFGGAK